ncbi:hypothetical protein Bbelb_085810 [Branchiostoma belcheri]|nr:hypothetical protein Bbelb_085810 [Branchiostoma belcheri]
MAVTLTKEQNEKLQQFLQNDQDGSGTVTAQEMIDFAKASGVNLTEKQEQEYRDWVARVDTDGDGAVSADEFRAMLEQSETFGSPSELFKTFDKDGNGFLDREEIKQGMAAMGQKLTDAEVDEMIKSCDMDGDGRINYEEFLKGFA